MSDPLDQESNKLLKEPWTNTVLNGQSHLVKFLISDKGGYAVAVTDLVVMWTEWLNKDEVIQRNQDLNPNLETSLSRLLQNIQSVFVEHLEEAAVAHNINIHTGKLTIETTSLLSELPFKWKYCCTSVSAKKFSENVLQPMVHLAAEHQTREQELCLILKRKDAEIFDYKSNGATVSRKHLATEVFDSKMFNEQIEDKRKNTDDSLQSAGAAVFGQEGKELYRGVMNRVVKNQMTVYLTIDKGTPNKAIVVEDNSSHLKAEEQPTNPVDSQKEEELRRRRILDQKLSQQQEKLHAKAQAKKKMKF